MAAMSFLLFLQQIFADKETSGSDRYIHCILVVVIVSQVYTYQNSSDCIIEIWAVYCMAIIPQ